MEWAVVSAVFSILALLGVLYMAFLQRKEVNYTRELLARENFESTLFNLITLHHERIRALEIYQAVGPNIQGRGCFNYMYYKSFVLLYGGNEDIYAHLPPLERVRNYYTQLYRIYEADLDYYFRNLFHILKFIDTSPVEPKWPYIKMLRAQLSAAELLLLFYHGLSSGEGEHMNPYIRKYALLTHMPQTSLLHENHHTLYPLEAFGIESVSENPKG